MRQHTERVDVRTSDHSQLLDITDRVRRAVAASGVRQGQVVVFVPHTTAGVTINENADPDVVHDLLAALDAAVPWRQDFYQHGEGNSAAHVKSSMVGCAQTVLIEEGELLLGTWQAVYFCEFDGPRHRQAVIRQRFRNGGDWVPLSAR
jgi:secondary thiamine-phosphate synthase enzyme